MPQGHTEILATTHFTWDGTRLTDKPTPPPASPSPGTTKATTAYTPLRFPGQYADPDPHGLAPDGCPQPGTEDDARLALARAEELQAIRRDYFMADAKGTTAVIGVYNSRTQEYSIRIGINGAGEMPTNWQLREGEEFVAAPGHAEEEILSRLGTDEYAVFGSASRNFCRDICLPIIDTKGIEIGGSGIRGHPPQN